MMLNRNQIGATSKPIYQYSDIPITDTYIGRSLNFIPRHPQLFDLSSTQATNKYKQNDHIIVTLCQTTTSRK